MAAVTVDLLVYPLDTIKTRFQSPAHRHLPLFRGLYQGLAPAVLATIPSSGLFFSVYEGVRGILPSSSAGVAAPLSNSAASACAEACSCLILTPAEVIKQNAQVLERTSSSSSNGSGSSGSRGSRTGQSSVVRAFRSIRTWRDLWTGYGALVARNLPYTALQMPLFELLKPRLLPRAPADGGASVPETVLWAGIAAGSSGSVAALVTTPIDVVKTRVMLSAGRPRAKRMGVSAVVKDVLRDEGFFRGLWRGGGLRCLWTFIGSGLFLGTYEGGRLWLAGRRGESRELAT